MSSVYSSSESLPSADRKPESDSTLDEDALAPRLQEMAPGISSVAPEMSVAPLSGESRGGDDVVSENPSSASGDDSKEDDIDDDNMTDAGADNSVVVVAAVVAVVDDDNDGDVNEDRDESGFTAVIMDGDDGVPEEESPSID